jgi:hypothetical protein
MPTFDSPEVTQLSTSSNIFSCKFIVLLFAHEGQEVFEARQDVVGRGDTLLSPLYHVISHVSAHFFLNVQ